MSREPLSVESRERGAKLGHARPCTLAFGQEARTPGLKNAIISSALSSAS